MALNEEKFKKMQDEMSRFEEEIGLPIPEVTIGGTGHSARIIGANTYNEAQKTLAAIPSSVGPGDLVPALGGLPPPPPPPSIAFIPPQVRPIHPMDGPRGHMDGGMQFNGMFRGPLPPPPMPPGPPLPPHLGPGPMPPGPLPPPPMQPGPMPPGFGMMGPPMGPGPLPPQMMPVPANFPGPAPPGFQPMNPPRFVPSAPQPVDVKPPQPVTTVLSATPMMYVANPQLEIAAIQAEGTPVHQMQSIQMESANVNVEDTKKNLNQNKKRTSHTSVETVFIPTQASNPSKKREKKNKKLIRTAGGQSWEDPTLAEWEDDDFRLFCGDLGNDVTDEVLTRAFSKYPSFLKARVVRDKRTNKTKGFGFVSFKDPQDFIRATKEMNGRYVGSRPIKLRKSSWRNRSLEVARKKEKEKAVLINMLTGRS